MLSEGQCSYPNAKKYCAKLVTGEKNVVFYPKSIISLPSYASSLLTGFFPYMTEIFLGSSEGQLYTVVFFPVIILFLFIK